MKKRGLGYYWRLYTAFVRSSFVREAEFRANFWAKVLVNFIWMSFFVITLKMVYAHTETIAGWTEGEAMLLSTTCYVLDAIIGTLFWFGLSELPTLVRQGTLDFVLFKPVNSLFWVSLRRISLDHLGGLVGAGVLGLYSLSLLHQIPGLPYFLLYFVMVGCGVLIYYSFHVMMMTLSIWFVRVENLWVLTDVFVQIGRFPTDIFDTILRRVFMYIIPIAFLATIPSKALLGKTDLSFLSFAILWALGFFIASQLFWRFALRSYTSASS